MNTDEAIKQLNQYGWELFKGDGRSTNCTLHHPLIPRTMSIHEAIVCHNSLINIIDSDKNNPTRKESINIIKLLSDGWSIDTSISDEIDMWWKQIHDGGRRIPYSEELIEIAEGTVCGEYFNKYFEAHPKMEHIFLTPSKENNIPSETPPTKPPQEHTIQYFNAMPASDTIEFDFPVIRVDSSIDPKNIKELVSEVQSLINAKALSKSFEKEISSIEMQIASLQETLDLLKKSIGGIKKLLHNPIEK